MMPPIFLDAGNLIWRCERLNAPVVGEGVEILVARAGIEQDDLVTLLQEALLSRS